jgi:predicted transglutaminase-like cysteine proteinase
VSLSQGQAFMRVYGRSEPPSGWVRMCQATPEACEGGSGVSSRVELSPMRWRDLIEVNAVANRTVKAMSDLEIYGVSEVWAIPQASGDCEDFALLKQQMLIERGWPVGALLITVVRDETGSGHAILTARTTKGDYALDNRVETVGLWNALPYTYIKRQSYLSPSIWMALDPAAMQTSPEVSASR